MVPRKSSMVSQVTELNYQEFMISSSRWSDSSRSNTGSSSVGGEEGGVGCGVEGAERGGGGLVSERNDRKRNLCVREAG